MAFEKIKKSGKKLLIETRSNQSSTKISVTITENSEKLIKIGQKSLS